MRASGRKSDSECTTGCETCEKSGTRESGVGPDPCPWNAIESVSTTDRAGDGCLYEVTLTSTPTSTATFSSQL